MLNTSSKLTIAIIAILLLPTVTAWTAFGVEGDKGTLFGGDVLNFYNWPQKAIELCEGAQARVIKQCAEAGFENWYVIRAISGDGTYNGKSLFYDVEDFIFGPSKCPPTEDITPAGVTARRIISEHIDYTKTSTDEKGLSDDAEITCDFLCSKWECPEDFNPYKICNARIVFDADIRRAGGDAKAAEEEAYEKGKRFAQESCEEQGENCRIRGCEMQAHTVEGTRILRVCCDCTCPITWFEPSGEWKWKDSVDKYFEKDKETAQRVKNKYLIMTAEYENLMRVFEKQKEVVAMLQQKAKQCQYAQTVERIPVPKEPVSIVALPQGPSEPVSKSCEELCSERGLSAQAVDQSQSIMSQLQQYRCVSGVRIRTKGVTTITGAGVECKCYSSESPRVEVDSTPPVCQTPCGPVQCDSSASCPCPDKPDCTLTAKCSWGGWKGKGEQIVPVIGTQATATG